MDWDELAEQRMRIGAALAVVIAVAWYFFAYQARRAELDALAAQETTLAAERSRVLAEIERERMRPEERRVMPSRVTAPPGPSMTPVERLNYFLDNITKPANALDLSYFTVTPLPPRSGANYEELPFSISVVGSYAALADYLYQLEYAQSFVVRNLVAVPKDGSVQADFQLSAILVTDKGAKPSAAPPKDPGHPTSLELARDPFVRPPAKLAEGPDGKSYFLNVPPGLVLSGVMHADGKAVAIINHEPYRIGSSIENKTITKISERGVELSDKVRSYFLEMERPQVSTVARTKENASR